MFILLWMKERMFWFEKGILFTGQSTNKLREECLLGKPSSPTSLSCRRQFWGTAVPWWGIVPVTSVQVFLEGLPKGSLLCVGVFLVPCYAKDGTFPALHSSCFKLTACLYLLPVNPWLAQRTGGWAMTELAFRHSFLLNGIKQQLLSFCTAGRARYRVRVCSSPALCGWDWWNRARRIWQRSRL